MKHKSSLVPLSINALQFTPFASITNTGYVRTVVTNIFVNIRSNYVLLLTYLNLQKCVFFSLQNWQVLVLRHSEGLVLIPYNWNITFSLKALACGQMHIPRSYIQLTYVPPSCNRLSCAFFVLSLLNIVL